jgi:hypothetical protein
MRCCALNADAPCNADCLPVCQSASPSVSYSRPIYHRDSVFVPVAWCRLLPSDLRDVLVDSVQSL